MCATTHLHNYLCNYLCTSLWRQFLSHVWSTAQDQVVRATYPTPQFHPNPNPPTPPPPPQPHLTPQSGQRARTEWACPIPSHPDTPIADDNNRLAPPKPRATVNAPVLRWVLALRVGVVPCPTACTLLLHASHSLMCGFQTVVDTALERAGVGFSNVAINDRLEAMQGPVTSMQECTSICRI